MTIITPDPKPITQIADEAVGLFYRQRVFMEEAAEFNAMVAPIWKRLPKDFRLASIADPSSGGLAYSNRALYRSAFSLDYGATYLSNTARLHVLVSDWPSFKHDDESKKDLIDTFTELLGLAEDAKSICDRIDQTQDEMRMLTNPIQMEHVGNGGHLRAQELRWWYGSFNTGRRHTIGWIVSGRGKTIHVLTDPLAQIRQIGPDKGAWSPRKTNRAIGRLSVGLSFGTDSLLESSENTLRFNLDNTSFTPILPPEIARERLSWARDITVKAVLCKAEVKEAQEKYAKWVSDTSEIRARKTRQERFEESLPSFTASVDDMEKIDGYRWLGEAGKHIISIATREIGADTLRKMVADSWMTKNGGPITEAEKALLDSAPVGDEAISKTQGLIFEKKYEGLDLAPTF
jgi:hypothetical protein